MKTALLIALGLFTALLLLVLFNLFRPGIPAAHGETIAYSDILRAADGGQVTDVVFGDADISGHLSDRRAFQTFVPSNTTLAERLAAKGVQVVKRPEEANAGLSLLLTWLPSLVFTAIWAAFLVRLTRIMSVLTRTVQSLLVSAPRGL